MTVCDLPTVSLQPDMYNKKKKRDMKIRLKNSTLARHKPEQTVSTVGLLEEFSYKGILSQGHCLGL